MTRFGRLDQVVARVLVVALLAMVPLPASAGREFNDANNTTFDDSVVALDNSQAGQTTFSIDTNRTTIGWDDLQQPEGNTLEFNFSDPNSTVLNSIGAQHPSNLNGTVISNGTVAFSNPFGIFIGDSAVINVGDLIAIGADVSTDGFMASQAMSLALTGTVENNGLIRAEGNVALFGSHVVNNGEIIAENGHVLALAGQHLHLQDWEALTSDFLAPKNFFGLLADGTVENHGSIEARNAALFGGRVVNFGEIEIDDGSLLMVGADAIWVTEFDNPVLIKIPNIEQYADQTSNDEGQDIEYAIENHGRIDAGLGHVRLAASDPLGFAIRQGTGRAEQEPASISAQRIEIEGGENGRVHLSGTIDASDLSGKGVGGEIDVTGSLIVLDGATIHASGTRAGGTIHLGGEQEGRGELQRARVAIVDEDSEIRADAIRRGDGGTVIVFAEDLTSVDGQISARGGRKGGDGGFVETSGLRNFHISRTPDLTARRGAAGSWLIDPFNIRITNTAPDCPAEGVACLNKAVEAILSPDFDPTGFDGILRTVDPDGKPVATEKPTVKSIVHSVKQNKPFLFFLAVFIISGLGGGIFYGMIYLFCDSYLQIGHMFPYILVVDGIFTFISLPFWMKIIYKFGKHRSWAVGNVLAGLVLVAMVFLEPGPSSFIPFAILAALRAVFWTGYYVVPTAMLGDIIDYDILRTSVNRSANYFSAATLVTKFNSALGGGLGFIIVGLIGYTLVGENSDLANIGFVVTAMILPAILMALGSSLLWFFPLDHRRQSIIRRRIESLAERAERDGHLVN